MDRRILRLALCLLTTAAAPAAAQPKLLDLNQEVVPRSAEPELVGTAGGWVLFTAEDDAHGRELWRTDGTPEGTALVVDLCPGSCQGQLSSWATLGDRLIFAATDAVAGRELWVSDGTAEGTRRLAELCPGPCSSAPHAQRVVGDRLYFAASDGVHGIEPWTSDGTAEGTRPLGDLCAGACGSHPRDFTPFAGGAVFLTLESVLWKSDGTAAGTVEVERICDGCDAAVQGMLAFDGRLWFGASDGRLGSELWVSDGTAAGTHIARNHRPGEASSGAVPLFVFRDELYFLVRGGQYFLPIEVWRTEGGDPAAAVNVPELAPLTQAPPSFAPAGDRVVAYLGGDALYGWRPGAALEKLATLGPGYIRLFTAGGGSLHVATLPYSGESQLWTSDGTAAGTRLVGSFGGFGSGAGGGIGIVSHWRGLFLSAGPWGSRRLWRSDGTAAGTVALDDPRPDLSPSNPYALTPFGGELYLWAKQGAAHAFLRSDGTPAGTRALAGVAPYQLAASGGRLFSITGEGLGELDGDAAAPVAAVVGAWDLTDAAPPGGAPRLFFARSEWGQELWTSDGTGPGTRLVADVNPEWTYGDQIGYLPTPRYPHSLTPFAGGVLFVASAPGIAGYQLWRSDGSAAGTVPLAEFEYDPDEITPLAGRALFAAAREEIGNELWTTDGTPAGTALVADLLAGEASSQPRALTALGGAAFFFATDAAGSDALWRSDGTPAGTRRVVELGLLGQPGRGGEIAAAGGRLFFTALHPLHGEELWTSDGTAAGTRLLEIRAGTAGAQPRALTPLGRRVFFAAADGVHGLELWTSDGTPAGTALVADLAPGTAASGPSWLRAGADRLWFAADDGVHGRELYLLEVAPEADGLCQPAADRLCLRGRRFAVTVDWRLPDGTSGRGRAVPASDESGLFWFFAPANLELMVKVLDGGAVNDHFWVLSGALSDVEYRLTIDDLATGARRSYENPRGRLCGVADVRAFSGSGPAAPAAAPAVVAPRLPTASSCGGGPGALCLGGGRYRVEATWRTPTSGESGQGQAVPLAADSGAFWFFAPANLELIVKVLDGAAVNGHPWIFWGALSDVEYELAVTDTATGAVERYRNPAGRYCGGADTSAF
jgi:ELWxxDGT repeat protein